RRRGGGDRAAVRGRRDQCPGTSRRNVRGQVRSPLPRCRERCRVALRPRDRRAPQAARPGARGTLPPPRHLPAPPPQAEAADVSGAAGPPAPTVVPEPVWTTWAREHTEVVDRLTAEHLDRRRRGEPHPVVDFLFTYYKTSVATMRRWHPRPRRLLETPHHTDGRRCRGAPAWWSMPTRSWTGAVPASGEPARSSRPPPRGPGTPAASGSTNGRCCTGPRPRRSATGACPCG